MLGIFHDENENNLNNNTNPAEEPISREDDKDNSAPVEPAAPAEPATGSFLRML